MEHQVTTSEPLLEETDSLLELERRVQGIADRFSDARRLQREAEQNAARLESLVSRQEQRIAQLESEVEELRSERGQVRERIEALLGRIESL
jgi:FtsZ-binding cell division protein ZapB